MHKCKLNWNKIKEECPKTFEIREEMLEDIGLIFILMMDNIK